MVYLSFIVLGLLQGLTEFLPISSSGHLVLFSRIFGISETLFVSIILHAATLLSICVVMRKELWKLIKNPFSKQTLHLIISTIFTLIIALCLYGVAKQSYLDNFVSFGFMITACLLILTDVFARQKNKSLDKKQSAIMGIAQGLALFPGISRSGATICSGVLSGGNKEEVTKHSFLMSIPIILGSLLMEIIEFKGSVVDVSFLPLLIGFIIAFVAGVLSLKFMLKLTNKIKFRYFAYYLILLSILSFFI